MCVVNYARNGYEIDYKVKSGYTAVACDCCNNTRFIKTNYLYPLFFWKITTFSDFWSLNILGIKLKCIRF